MVNSVELHRCKMLRLCKKKTRFNKHTLKLWWKVWKQTGSSFWSPQMDPPESSTSYTCFLFTAEAPAWQKNNLIGFGLHYSFSLLNNSFSPLRSSEVTINTSSWMQCCAKNKLGLQGMMHLPQHVPQEHQPQHSPVICISEHKNTTRATSQLGHEKTQENLKVHPDLHTGITSLANLETRKHCSRDATWGLCIHKQSTWFLCQERRSPDHSFLRDTFLA